MGEPPLDDGDVAAMEEALFGSMRIDSTCNATEAQVLGASWTQGRSWARSRPYEVCVRRRVRETYDPCNGRDPFEFESRSFQATKLAAITQSGDTNNVEVRCADILGGDRLTSAGDQYWYGHPNTERFAIDHTVANTSTNLTNLQRAASIMWHEVTHTHTYQHTQPSPAIDCGDPSGFDPEVGAAPSIVENCMVTASLGSHAQLFQRSGLSYERLGPGIYQRDHIGIWNVAAGQGYKLTLCSGYIAGTPPTCGEGPFQVFPTNVGTDLRADIPSVGLDLTLAQAGTSYVEVRPMAVISDGPDWSGTKWPLPEGTFHPFDLGMMYDQIRSPDAHPRCARRRRSRA